MDAGNYAVGVLYNDINNPRIKFKPIKVIEGDENRIAFFMESLHNEGDFVITAVGTKEFLLAEYKQLKAEYFND